MRDLTRDLTPAAAASPRVTMHISPDFHDHTRPGAGRVSFQFSACGTRQCGVIYVTMAVGEAHLETAERAARIAARRAGADTVTLCHIVNPVR